MRVSRLLAIAAVAASFGTGPVEAQSLSEKTVPAEFPPASYTGRQYVDSEGCVFVRAGIDGNTTWVPRVTRGRKVICGFKPSLPSARSAQSEPQPRAEPQPRSAPETQPARRVETQARQTAPARAVRRAPVAEPRQPAPRTAPTVAAGPAKPRSKAAAPSKRVTKKVPAPTAETSCKGLSKVSQRYAGTSGVRCGPQTVPHVTYLSGGGGTGAKARPMGDAAISPRITGGAAHGARTAATSPVVTEKQVARLPGSTRIVPRHVHEKQVKAHGIAVPEGYKKVWDDDRLNPYRAHQTVRGKARMEVIWSRTVPRYLIERETGRDVTYKYPGLQYPYTSFAEQRAAGVTVVTQGQVVPDPVRVTRSAGAAPRTVVSTQSAPAPKKIRAASHRFVQAGVFRDRAQAEQAARRLANTGLPARMGRLTRGDETYSLVLAGPFRTQPDLQHALRQVRGAGFANARLRK